MAEKFDDIIADIINTTYQKIRIGAALIGVLFPLVLWAGSLLSGNPLEPTISHYYYTEMRDVFVGSLFALGVLLYLYKGFEPKEDNALNLAGILAVIIALVPTAKEGYFKNIAIIKDIGVHGACAFIFFLTIAYVSWTCGKYTLQYLESEEDQELFGNLYKIIAIAMGVVVFSAVLILMRLDDVTEYPIGFFIELAAIWVFAAYWIVQTVVIIKIRQNPQIENWITASRETRVRPEVPSSSPTLPNSTL